MRAVLARAGVAVVAACAAFALTACTSGHGTADTPTQTQTAWTELPSGSASTGAPSARFVPGGAAAQNRGAFDAAIRGVVQTSSNAGGDAVVSALVSAGFDRAAMQVSSSTTSAKLQPGSISVAVKLGSQCLIGQWGGAIDGYHSTVAQVLGSGGCLIGGTAPLD